MSFTGSEILMEFVEASSMKRVRRLCWSGDGELVAAPPVGVPVRRMRRRTSMSCRHGHPWTKENTRYEAGKRVCVRCRRETDLRRRLPKTAVVGRYVRSWQVCLPNISRCSSIYRVRCELRLCRAGIAERSAA
jgi:hypothetical protein